MKKLLFLFLALILFACSKDDGDQQAFQEQEEFYDLITGTYRMRAATTDEPIDLNGDGIPHTDLYKEVVYCNFSLILDSFDCHFTHKLSYNGSFYNGSDFRIPTSEYAQPESEQIPSSCIRDVELPYNYKADAKTGEVYLVGTDHYIEYAAGFYVEFLAIHWENKRVFLKLRKRFRLPSGDTKWVILHLEYKKMSDS